MVRYYGYYSNKSRGMRKKQGKDSAVPVLIESDPPASSCVACTVFIGNGGQVFHPVLSVRIGPG
ncbi:MAG: hypothetical protein U9R02_11075 [Thermodesulfobacteriota bacterium]|nr:hypothetical protein [Thermodesulfobacteriota bacterium]